MAKCWKCFKRCQARRSCAWCGRGPMCLNCKCDCRLWEAAERAAEADAATKPRASDAVDPPGAVMPEHKWICPHCRQTGITCAAIQHPPDCPEFITPAAVPASACGTCFGVGWISDGYNTVSCTCPVGVQRDEARFRVKAAALVPQPLDLKDDRELCWLIESPSQGTRYEGGAGTALPPRWFGHPWTENASKAIRFYRRADAEQCLEALCSSGWCGRHVIVTEHIFLNRIERVRAPAVPEGPRELEIAHAHAKAVAEEYRNRWQAAESARAAEGPRGETHPLVKAAEDFY